MMRTPKQEALIHSFLSAMADENRPLYQEIILYLDELGYHPKKEKAEISFKHGLHNKQIAKMGFRKGNQAPFFALRFSACKGYSQRFSDIVGTAIIKYPHKAPGCIHGSCHFCAGEPDTHVYQHTFPDGQVKAHCGAYALEVPDMSPGDIEQIKQLIKAEHAYLLKHEAGMACLPY